MSSSLESIYRRSGLYFIIPSVRTTAGLWMHDGTSRRLDESATGTAELGGEVLADLTRPSAVVAHPPRDQWSQVRATLLKPILQQAGVRSWRAFVTAASLVEVEQISGEITIIPMRQLPKPTGAFEPDSQGPEVLDRPSPSQLGEAILRAFDRN